MSRRWETRSVSFWFALLAAFSLAGPLPSVRAAFTPIGDVEPANPSTWGSTTTGYIGNTASGTLTVDGGSDLVSGTASIGNSSTGSGLVSVTGSGSIWASTYLYIGNSGSGALSISAAGSLSSPFTYLGNSAGSMGAANVTGRGSIWTDTALTVGAKGTGTVMITGGGSGTSVNATIGYSSNSAGSVTIDGSGSTWTTTDQLCVGSVLQSGMGFAAAGRLSITNGGSLITRNSNSDYSTYVGVALGSTGTIIVDGTGSTWQSDSFVVGCYGNGSVLITNGGRANSFVTAIGYYSGGTNVVAVEGAGSALTDSDTLYVGYSSSGTLRVLNGGTVTSYAGFVGFANGCSGMATVDGIGSTWTCTSTLYVGNSLVVHPGGGTLSIAGEGAVAANSVSVSNLSLLAIDVGRGSVLSVASGAGTITNNGTVRILAGAGVPANGVLYSPIAAGSWGGTGTYQAVGGTWSSTSHTFTASSVTSGTSGTPVPLELATVQRAIVDDNGLGGTNWEVGASFVAATSTTNIAFTATAMNSAILDILRADLPANESILSGWTFATTNYAVSSTNPVYLSFQVGAGQPSDLLEVWHYDGSAWTEYPTNDLTYDGNYASFTATGLSGYAMVVAEPSTLPLLAAGLFGLLAYAWRRRRG
jgi:T5SS/PEP-CTERM-associated repeat protein